MSTYIKRRDPAEAAALLRQPVPDLAADPVEAPATFCDETTGEQIEHKATHAEREKDAADDRIEELYAQARASAAQA